MSAFQEKINQIMSIKKNRIIVGIIIFFIIVIVPIVFSIIGMNALSEKKIVIDNFLDFFSDFPDGKREEIESELYKKVFNSGEFGVNDIPSSGALVQPDSLYSFTLEPSFVYGDFVVEVLPINRSYIISYTYGNARGGMVMEYSATNTIFDVDDYRFKRYDPIDFLVPVEFEDLYFTLISTTSSETKSRRALVAVLDPPDSVYLADGIGELQGKVMEKIKSYLDSFGLSIENYKVNFRFRIAE